MATGQALPTASRGAGVTLGDDSETPDPNVRGWTLAVATTGSHDSITGWSLLESPSVAYRLNRVLSADATLPVYPYLQAVRTGKKANVTLAGHTLVLGDMVFAAHVALGPPWLGYIGTLSLSAPTGNRDLGVGTGTVGFNENNHVEHSFGIFDPQLEVGIGNNSTLVRRRTVKSYTSSGKMLFGQAGVGVELPRGFSVDGEAYEQLPLGGQTTYSRTTRKNGTALLMQASDAEDNGFSVELDAPELRRVLVNANFTRSVRLTENTFSISLTYLLHRPGVVK